MHAELTVLGSHGPLLRSPDDSHANAAVALQGRQFLLDCGGTTPQSMAAADVRLETLEGIFVTHVHGDHIGGIEELAWKLYYGAKRKLRVIAPEPVWEELHPYLDAVLTPFRPRGELRVSQSLSGILELVILAVKHGRTTPWVDEASGLTVFAEEVTHIPGKPCYSYVVENPLTMHAIWWSGDTIFNSDRAEAMASRCSLLFHDCSMGTHYPATVHAHLPQLLTLPKEVKAKTVLIHHNDADGGAGAKEFKAVAVRGSRFEF